MRTITKEINVYTFPELSETAKCNVKQWLSSLEPGAESVLEDFLEVSKILGYSDVMPRYSGFGSQGDGASFTGRYSYAKGASKAIREYAGRDEELWGIADTLQATQKKHFYKLEARIVSNSHCYAHENTVDVEVFADGEWAEEEAYNEVKEQSRRLMRWLYKQLETNYDYYQTDEYAEEMCASNGYEFTVDGTII